VTEERARIVRWWQEFAVEQCRGYSPLYERICTAVADDDRVLDLVEAAPPFGQQPNVLLAAVHDLVLQGVEHPLADVYAAAAAGDHHPREDEAGALFCDLVHAHEPAVRATLAFRRTNTNECGRSAVLVPGLRWLADHLGEPIALLDVGTSAGLNLHLDRYRLNYTDGRATGPADSPVAVACALIGDGRPPIADEAPAIAGRAGLDRAPVDLTDPAEERWMLACVWPDTGRLDRTRAAIRLAREHPVDVVAGDAVDDLPAAVGRLPGGVPLVVTTSWVLAYLRRTDRRRFVDALAALSTDRPVAWLSAEGPGVVEGLPDPPPRQAGAPTGVEPSLLAAFRFEGGRVSDRTLLARCHPHGSELEWLHHP
jgi:hypothetical protein